MSNLAWMTFLAWVIDFSWVEFSMREWHILRRLPFLRESYNSITAFIIHSKLATLCMTSSRCCLYAWL